ncbi:helix-turn-helix domain-containing protein [uncultured Chryseobacterium sp.]|uniref:helix-turn-helix domain-containing protein n=1 Tax=uncultured Chryseobacterium sp. TaxID=259322 RepID=UPI0025EAB7C9|nr:helix-turn-helix domain-containing protein [uncultured Chryseobacterium sp.]
MRQQRIVENIPQAFNNPNSVSSKNAERNKALEALEKAKSLQRPVRYAASGESSFSTLNAKSKPKNTEKVDGDLPTDQAAKYVGLARSTFSNKFQNGIIKGRKIRNRAYFEKEELDRYLDSQKKE